MPWKSGSGHWSLASQRFESCFEYAPRQAADRIYRNPPASNELPFGSLSSILSQMAILQPVETAPAPFRQEPITQEEDRKSVVLGKRGSVRVGLGGRRNI